MVWVGAAQFEAWARNPLPIAVYGKVSLGRRSAVNSLAHQGRPYKVVYESSNLAGQIAAVESGLAVAALTQCSAPPAPAGAGPGARAGAAGADAGGGVPQPSLAGVQGDGQPAPHAAADAAARGGLSRRAPGPPRRSLRPIRGVRCALARDSAGRQTHGLMTAAPAASKGPTSRVATANPLAAAMAAM